jgi:hypothetical protein
MLYNTILTQEQTQFCFTDIVLLHSGQNNSCGHLQGSESNNKVCLNNSIV